MSEIHASKQWYFIGLEGQKSYAPVNQNKEIMIPCQLCEKLRIFGLNCEHCVPKNKTPDV